MATTLSVPKLATGPTRPRQATMDPPRHLPVRHLTPPWGLQNPSRKPWDGSNSFQGSSKRFQSGAWRCLGSGSLENLISEKCILRNQLFYKSQARSTASRTTWKHAGYSLEAILTWRNKEVWCASHSRYHFCCTAYILNISLKQQLQTRRPHVKGLKRHPQGFWKTIWKQFQLVQNASNALPRGLLELGILKAWFFKDVLYGINGFDNSNNPTATQKLLSMSSGLFPRILWNDW